MMMSEISYEEKMEFIADLTYRRNFIRKHFGWKIPNIVWNYYIGLIEDDVIDACGNVNNIVDNLAVNGDYGDLSEYKYDYETKEEAKQRLEGEALALIGYGKNKARTFVINSI